jgi:hypothetical protein
VMIGGSFYAERYSDDNTFPATVAAVPFVNAAGGDYRLTTNSLTSSSTQEAPGIDANALCAALGDIGRQEPVCSKPLTKDRGPAQTTKTE